MSSKTLADFKKLAKASDHNSCNAWGFGGSFGKIYKLGNLEHGSLKYSTRHSGSYSTPTFYVDSNPASKTDFLIEFNKQQDGEQ